MTHDQLKETLDTLASRMPSVSTNVFDTPTELNVEYVTGSLVWSDERPAGKLDPNQANVLKSLLVYRTRLIFNENPPPELQEVWDHSMAAFPCWIGFAHDRLHPNLDIVEKGMNLILEYRQSMLSLLNDGA